LINVCFTERYIDYMKLVSSEVRICGHLTYTLVCVMCDVCMCDCEYHCLTVA